MTTIADDIQIKIKSINEGHMAILSRQEEILIEAWKRAEALFTKASAASILV